MPLFVMRLDEAYGGELGSRVYYLNETTVTRDPGPGAGRAYVGTIHHHEFSAQGLFTGYVHVAIEEVWLPPQRITPDFLQTVEREISSAVLGGEFATAPIVTAVIRERDETMRRAMDEALRQMQSTAQFEAARFAGQAFPTIDQIHANFLVEFNRASAEEQEKLLALAQEEATRDAHELHLTMPTRFERAEIETIEVNFTIEPTTRVTRFDHILQEVAA